MGSGLRFPLPWEQDQKPRKVVTELEPAPEPEDLAPVLPEVRAVMRSDVLQEQDPNRRRRGAAGAADAVFRESEARGWGYTRETARERVNRARATCASKKRS